MARLRPGFELTLLTFGSPWCPNLPTAWGARVYRSVFFVYFGVVFLFYRGVVVPRRIVPMASCGLCRKGLRQQFVAKSDGAEYVRCSNRACGYFCSLDQLPSYERMVQLDVAWAFTGGDAPLCQHQKPCALRVSRSVKNGGRPYFTCRERWLCTFVCWADLEVILRRLSRHLENPPFFLSNKASHVFNNPYLCVE